MTSTEARPCYIYALCEPDATYTVRYVGKTQTGLRRRYNQHLAKGNLIRKSHKNFWIKRVLSSGLRPVMVELECVPPGGNWAERERYWIAYYRQLGFDLTNATDGGEGSPGYRPPDEIRERISNRLRGRKLSPESRARISEMKRGNKNRLGQSPSPETREKLRQHNLGKTLSDETRAKMSEVRKGRQPSESNYKALNSPETIAKRSETRRRKTQLQRLAALFDALLLAKEAS